MVFFSERKQKEIGELLTKNSRRGEGGVGFLVRECLVSEVEFITSMEYEESV